MAGAGNGNRSTQEGVALGVIILSGLGISIVAIIAIWAGTYATSPDNRNLIMTVFNTLIPMFGTWVGTVIAFYFSCENFATAAQTTRELVGQLGDERLRQIPVKNVWIPVAAIEAITVDVGREGTVAFADVRAKLSGKVSRIPVWDQNKVVRYVIHESMIYKFLAERPPAAGAPAPRPSARSSAPRPCGGSSGPNFAGLPQFCGRWNHNGNDRISDCLGFGR